VVIAKGLSRITKAASVKRERVAYLLFGGAMILVMGALTTAVLYGPLP
jgi:hypothetical protein